MYALFLKEIRSFLSSLIGYMAIGVFLGLLGLLMWIIDNDATGMNVLDNGYANLDPLFFLGPWVFLFLIPAITMRSFSEERKQGTMELLMTKPLTDFQIVAAKFLAGFVLVIFSLLPTLLYYYTIHELGNPIGNLDSGAIWGSYIGLLCLGAAFVSVGVFASSISENQVIAFIMALILCFLCYTGFEFIASSTLTGRAGSIVAGLGLSSHYTSISRGVVDTRDVLYFASIVLIFMLSTRLVLQSRKW